MQLVVFSLNGNLTANPETGIVCQDCGHLISAVFLINESPLTLTASPHITSTGANLSQL